MNREAKRKETAILPLADLSDFKGMHRSEKCFICGAGPTFGFLDLTKIHEHIVISVNSSIMRLNWDLPGDSLRRFWISNDSLCLKWSYFWDKVMHGECTRIIRTSWQRHESKLKAAKFRYFAPRLSEKHPLDENDVGLCSVSSVPTALDFAILLGCREIYLLGVDHRLISRFSHFWQMWPRSQRPRRFDKDQSFIPPIKQQVDMFKENKQVFQSLHWLAKKNSIQIFNCSKQSDLDVFPFKSLDDATKS